MTHPAPSPLVSFVVPFYNNSAALPALLDSLLRQSLKSLEVVVVDDASRESCSDIVDAYRGKGMNITLIRHAANQGAKNARLTGIEAARGRIIAFADADDTLYGNSALEAHALLMEESGADILQFASLFHNRATGRESVPAWHGILGPSIEGAAVFKAWVDAWGRGGTMWNKLYSRELCLTDLEFNRASKVRWACEDFYLSAFFMFHARSYRGSGLVGYRYMDDFDATCAQKAAGRMADLVHVLDELVPYFAGRGCAQDTLDQFAQVALRALRVNFRAACAGRYPKRLPMPTRLFQSRTGYVDGTTLARALHLLLRLERPVDDEYTATAGQRGALG